MFRKKAAFLFQVYICLVFSVLLSSCAGKKEDGNSSADTSTRASLSTPPPQVVAITVAKQSVPLYKDWVGQTDANQTVNIRARVDGILEKASFKEGDFVNKGQVLFQIERDTYEAALEAARAQLEKAQAQLMQARQQVELKEQKALLAKYESALTLADQNLTRTRNLFQQGALSQHDLDQAVDDQQQAKAQVDSQRAKVADTGLNKISSIDTQKANVDAAKAAVKQAQLNLDYTTIRSPLRGIIGRIEVYPGNLVSKADNTTLATISEVDPIKVVFNVSESEYLKVAKQYAATGKAQDNPLELHLADNTVYSMKGHFRWVDRAVDSKTGTISIEAVFPNPQAILRPGEFARVGSKVDTLTDALVIPDKCIQDLQGSKVVYVVGPDSKVELKTVTLGPNVNGNVVVESGLEAGQKVILEGQQKARPGDLVVLVDQKSQ